MISASLGAQPASTVATVSVKAISTSARDIDAAGYDYNTGHGLIDAEAAMKAADAIVAARPPKP